MTYQTNPREIQNKFTANNESNRIQKKYNMKNLAVASTKLLLCPLLHRSYYLAKFFFCSISTSKERWNRLLLDFYVGCTFATSQLFHSTDFVGFIVVGTLYCTRTNHEEQMDVYTLSHPEPAANMPREKNNIRNENGLEIHHSVISICLFLVCIFIARIGSLLDNTTWINAMGNEWIHFFKKKKSGK